VDHFAVDDNRAVGGESEPHTVRLDGQNPHFDFAVEKHLPAVTFQGGVNFVAARFDGKERPAVLRAADNDALTPAVDVDLFAGLKS